MSMSDISVDKGNFYALVSLDANNSPVHSPLMYVPLPDDNGNVSLCAFDRRNGNDWHMNYLMSSDGNWHTVSFDGQSYVIAAYEIPDDYYDLYYDNETFYDVTHNVSKTSYDIWSAQSQIMDSDLMSSIWTLNNEVADVCDVQFKYDENGISIGCTIDDSTGYKYSREGEKSAEYRTPPQYKGNENQNPYAQHRIRGLSLTGEISPVGIGINPGLTIMGIVNAREYMYALDHPESSSIRFLVPTLLPQVQSGSYEFVIPFNSDDLSIVCCDSLGNEEILQKCRTDSDFNDWLVFEFPVDANSVIGGYYKENAGYPVGEFSVDIMQPAVSVFADEFAVLSMAAFSLSEAKPESAFDFKDLPGYLSDFDKGISNIVNPKFLKAGSTNPDWQPSDAQSSLARAISYEHMRIEKGFDRVLYKAGQKQSQLDSVELNQLANESVSQAVPTVSNVATVTPTKRVRHTQKLKGQNTSFGSSRGPDVVGSGNRIDIPIILSPASSSMAQQQNERYFDVNIPIADGKPGQQPTRYFFELRERYLKSAGVDTSIMGPTTMSVSSNDKLYGGQLKGDASWVRNKHFIYASTVLDKVIEYQQSNNKLATPDDLSGEFASPSDDDFQSQVSLQHSGNDTPGNF